LLAALRNQGDSVALAEVDVNAAEKNLTLIAETVSDAIRKAQVADGKLEAYHLDNLCFRPRKVFQYPIGRSHPFVCEQTHNRVQFFPSCPVFGFVTRAAVIASYGCRFHPACTAKLIALQRQHALGAMSHSMEPGWPSLVAP
jgi:hypothetical protein